MLIRTLAVAILLAFTQFAPAAIAGTVSERHFDPFSGRAYDWRVWRAYGWGAYDMCLHGYWPWGHTYACLNDHGRPHCGCWANAPR